MFPVYKLQCWYAAFASCKFRSFYSDKFYHFYTLSVSIDLNFTICRLWSRCGGLHAYYDSYSVTHFKLRLLWNNFCRKLRNLVLALVTNILMKYRMLSAYCLKSKITFYVFFKFSRGKKMFSTFTCAISTLRENTNLTWNRNCHAGDVCYRWSAYLLDYSSYFLYFGTTCQWNVYQL